MPDLPVITLDEERHLYTVDGVARANVTSALKILIEVEALDVFVDTTTHKHIPADMVRQAGGYGRAFHKGAAFIVNGKSIKYPPEMEDSFSELRRWRKVEQAVTVASEMRVYCPKLNVAGTLDWIGHLKRNDVLNLVDWKTSKYNLMVGPQTWAYASGYRAMTGYKGVIKRWAWIYDKSKGEYKFVELTDDIGDEHEFRSRLFDYFWRRRLR